MKTLRPIILLLLLACTSTGCSYLEARGRDFADCFKLSIGAGFGIDAYVRCGPMGLGAGIWHGYNAGLEKGGRKLVWRSTEVGWPIGALYLIGMESFVGSITREPLSRGAYKWWLLSLTLIEDYEDPKRSLDYYFFVPQRNKDQLPEVTEYFWIEASLKVFIGVKVGFNLAEFADFILGWFGFDICGDDEREEETKEPVKEEKEGE